MKDEYVRSIPKSDKLQCADVLFTIGTIPCIVFIQLFSSCELIETIFEWDGRATFGRDKRERNGGVHIEFDTLSTASGTC
jgi:hypothetical protein